MTEADNKSQLTTSDQVYSYGYSGNLVIWLFEPFSFATIYFRIQL